MTITLLTKWQNSLPALTHLSNGQMDLELQLSQARNELSSLQLIFDLLSKELKHKQDEQSPDVIRNGYGSQVTSNYQKKPQKVGENSTHYIPTTTNRFELLSNHTKDTDVSWPAKDTDKDPRNYSR